MKWIHCVLVAAALVVGSLAASRAEPRAEPVQSTAINCLCDGSVIATIHSHPCIATVTHGGEVSDGRCDKPPRCAVLPKNCNVNVNWIITAKPGCTPNFAWTDGMNGVQQAGNMPVYSSFYANQLPCDDFRIVTILADGAPVLDLIITCRDCRG